MQAGEYREERRFLMKDDAVAPAAIDSTLMQGLPGNLELVRAEAVTPAEIALALHETLLNPLRRRDETLSLTRREDPYEVTPLLKTDNRYFLQIDEPAAAAEDPKERRQREKQQLLNELAAELQSLGATAMIQCHSQRSDADGYVRAHHGFLVSSRNAGLDRLKQILQSQYNRLYHGGRAASWRRVEGSTEVLGTLAEVALESKGGSLAIGNSAAFVHSLLNSAAIPLPSNRAVHYYARLDLNQLRPRYGALFQWLDYPGVARNPSQPPPFFSANLGSLLAALAPVETVAAQHWMESRTLYEEVIYRGQL